MTTKELYYEFSLLSQRNSERGNINISIENFVYLFNREARRFLNEQIKTKNSTDSIQYISDLLVKHYELKQIDANDKFIKYSRPSNFFLMAHGNNYSTVTKGSCNGIIYNDFKKPNDFNVSIEDTFTKPSFDWERGLGEIVSDGIIIHKGDDFKILKTYLSYYKEFTKIDVAGYIDVNGNNSSNVNPIESDYLLSMIVERVVTEVNREFDNVGNFNLSKERQNTL